MKLRNSPTCSPGYRSIRALALSLTLLCGAACEDESEPLVTLDAAAVGIGTSAGDAATPGTAILDATVSSADLDSDTPRGGAAGASLDAGSSSAVPRGESDAATSAASADDAGAADVIASDAGTVAASTNMETVVLRSKLGISAAGSAVFELYPYILFKDGSACADMNFVVEGLDVQTHKAMYPNTWTAWMIIDGKVALQNGDKWEILQLQNRYAPLPASQELDNRFRRLSGGATVTGDIIVAETVIRFLPGHRFVQGSYAGVSTSSVVAISTPPDKQGSYAIDGYQIELRFDNGTSSRTSIVYAPTDRRTLFLGGRSYLGDDAGT